MHHFSGLYNTERKKELDIIYKPVQSKEKEASVILETKNQILAEIMLMLKNASVHEQLLARECVKRIVKKQAIISK